MTVIVVAGNDIEFHSVFNKDILQAFFTELAEVKHKQSIESYLVVAKFLNMEKQVKHLTNVKNFMEAIDKDITVNNKEAIHSLTVLSKACIKDRFLEDLGRDLYTYVQIFL